ncbi:MAG: glucosidase, partial [Chloroflexota bacterium]|nr:glucosidase [Chloroflexota bacterium]
MDAERQRLAEAVADQAPWYRWGPYLSERQWGTVREDYSADGDAWAYVSYDEARSRAYRWGEDGLLGIADERCILCFALALWNEADPILKERPFGLTNPQGNHGEDLKEYYFYLDNTPTHSSLKALYKYPQRPFPYEQLVEVNGRLGQDRPEFELMDTGAFAEDRYFDVVVEYAKAGPEDICIRLSATNRGPDTAPLHLLPTLWFRNTWSWGRDDARPHLSEATESSSDWRVVHATHPALGERWLACQGSPRLLFTENDSNAQRLWNAPNRTPFVKDGIQEAVIQGNAGAVNPANTGTKVAAQYSYNIEPGATEMVYLRLNTAPPAEPPAAGADVFTARQAEADAFYAALPGGSDDARLVQRQALAGLLWSKQFYNYNVRIWLEGDPAEPPPSE